MMRSGVIAALLLGMAVALGISVANAILPDRLSAAPSGPAAATPRLPADHSIRDILSPAEQAVARRDGLLPAGTHSLLRTDGTMRHGDYHWNDDGVAAGPLTIWVDLRTQLISVFRGGHEIGTAVIVYGDDTMQSPLGRFPILSKHRDYHSRSYDAPMPYSLFINNSGVALHGSPMSSRRATHGCIGLPDEFARLLFDAAKVGDTVEIIRSDAMRPARRRLTLIRS